MFVLNPFRISPRFIHKFDAHITFKPKYLHKNDYLVPIGDSISHGNWNPLYMGHQKFTALLTNSGNGTNNVSYIFEKG